MQEFPRYLYRAPFVVTGNGPIIADGAVLTENGLVVAVGSYAELKDVDAQVEDYEGHVITPSLVNCHAHLELSYLAGLAGDCPAPGDIVGWINSDDTFLPGALDAVVKQFQADTDCSVVFGDYHAIDEKGAILYSTRGFCGTYAEMIRWWDYTYAIHQPTVFVRKAVFQTAGLLDESYHYTMDYEWWLRVAQHYRFQHIPHYIATYRMHRDAKTFAPLEQYVYPEQLRASKEHWGSFWQPRYWSYRKSYQMWLLRKSKETLHNPALQDWHDETKKT